MFHVRNLSVLSYAQGFTLWHYRAEATPLAEILAPGFLDEAAEMFAPGDILLLSGTPSREGALRLVAATSPRLLLAPLA